MLCPLIGTRLDGTSLAELDETGGIGTPVWGPRRLLRDLELRLGLLAPEASACARLVAWRAKVETACANGEPFFARSYRVDPLGTAQMLLDWRDALVEGGWDGAAIEDGGARLDAFVRMEVTGGPMPPGSADRLARVERTLRAEAVRPYDTLTLATDVDDWPARWRRTIALLERNGVRVAQLPTKTPPASGTSDLGRLQATLALNTSIDSGAPPLSGDGSLLLLEAPCALEAADAVGALARTWPREQLVFIRGGEFTVLDDALAAQGLPQLGEQRTSPWRGPSQLLPLMLHLSFEPVDPRRLLELFDLRTNPLPVRVRHTMARAVGDSPGIGDVRWQRAKRRLVEDGESIAEIEAWLEAPRHDSVTGAPRAALADLARRIAEWLRSELGGPHAEACAAAYEQCLDFLHLLGAEPRDRLDRTAVQRLLDVAVAGGSRTPIAHEEAGRFDHVDDPAALLTERDHVVWWYFAAGTTHLPHRLRWRAVELDALARTGVELHGPETRLVEETRSWRAAAMRARRQLVLVAPSSNRGDPLTRHPFWDEIVARLHLDEAQTAAITVTAADLLARRRFHLDVEELSPLELPPARPAWNVAIPSVTFTRPMSPVSVQSLAECPLQWALENSTYRRATHIPAVAHGAKLNGLVAHRLVEVLVEQGAFVDAPEAIVSTLDALLPGIAATLLQPGMGVELHQLRHQLGVSIAALANLLARAGLRLVATEHEVMTSWSGFQLTGRLDLLVRTAAGVDAVIDLKWSRTRYVDELASGRALQLALYAESVRSGSARGTLPATAYFCLSRGELLSTEPGRFGLQAGVCGPSDAETLARLEQTLPLIRETLEAGTIPVTGVPGAPPILEALGIPEPDHDRHFESKTGAGCQSCSFGAVCGKTWSGFR